MADQRTRYAVVGTGSRSGMFTSAILKDFPDRAELVAMCDINQVRMDHWNRRFSTEFGHAPVPTYGVGDFARMVRERRVDVVIVTTMDRTHHRYIGAAMDLGCDVITEKPMTVDAEQCQQVLDAIRRTGRRLQVAFNYRYAPRNSKVKELLMSGAIGTVLSLHFEWLLDTRHGADYFRRWHRDKRNSGGLMVHKATHHFDLVNWWLGTRPQTVYGMGGLRFYGRENAEQRGITRFYDRGTGHPNAQGDPFALDLGKSADLRALYLDAEGEDGYRRDQSVFDHGISIEDDMGVMVRYASGAVMTYHLTAYSPWEGYRVAFNGTRGRLECDVEERSYVSGDDQDGNRPEARDGAGPHFVEPHHLRLRPHWGEPLEIPVEDAAGGHGGGDVRLLRDLFVGADDDPLGRAADHIDGAWSILTGIAANRSFASGLPVQTGDLVRFAE